jgi:hypothetical protein
MPMSQRYPKINAAQANTRSSSTSRLRKSERARRMRSNTRKIMLAGEPSLGRGRRLGRVTIREQQVVGSDLLSGRTSLRRAIGIAACALKDFEQKVFPRWPGYYHIFAGMSLFATPFVLFFKTSFGWSGMVLAASAPQLLLTAPGSSSCSASTGARPCSRRLRSASALSTLPCWRPLVCKPV